MRLNPSMRRVGTHETALMPLLQALPSSCSTGAESRASVCRVNGPSLDITVTCGQVEGLSVRATCPDRIGGHHFATHAEHDCAIFERPYQDGEGNIA